MLSEKELKKIEIELYDQGTSDSVRSNIRKSKICIIDNQIDDLKSLHDNLKLEGFSNIEKFKSAPAINAILGSKYDLIILDLNDVAKEITEDDGKGILRLLKERAPDLPILVVTGKRISPEDHPILNKADLIRKKPTLASDLANDVETILIYRYDKFWTALTLIRELNKVDIELKKEIGLARRIKLHFLRNKVEKKLIHREEDIVDKLHKMAQLLSNITSLSHKAIQIIKLLS